MATLETGSERSSVAERDDMRRIFGPLDDTKVLEILALHPTLRNVEDASRWLAAPEALKGVAAEIVAILTADEQEEPPRQY